MTQLRSGEFHYFRVPRTAWAERLDALAEAGLNAVSIYVPWNWHEPRPGELDLTGVSTPERDLVGALDAIEAAGLDCVYRPGPFITAEWRDGGIPSWLWERHPEILALDSEGRVAGAGRPYPALTYAHPAYEEACARWLEAALEPVLPRLASRGGRVVNVQLDDEPSYWQQLSDPLALDYNPYLVGGGERSRYAAWLAERHGGQPPATEPPRRGLVDLSELPAYIDWLDFKLAQVDQHVRFLYDLVRRAGVDVAVSMLHPYLLPLQAAKFGAWARAEGLDLELTNECYLALFTAGSTPEQKVASVIACHETYHMWRDGLGEPVTMELQGSNASFIEPGAMELLYGTTIARGIRGFNLFMAVGGENPRGYENLTGREYDLGAPVALDGTRRPNYAVVAKTAQVMQALAPVLESGTPVRDAWIGAYVPYEAAALTAGDALFDRSALASWAGFGDIGLSDAPTLQALLTLSGVSWGCLDLERASDDALAAAPQLWVPTLPFLDRATQERLLAYARAGGNLVLVGCVPTLDLDGTPCTLLADAVGTADVAFDELREGVERYALVRAEGSEVLVARGAAAAVPVPAGGEVLARRDLDDAPCAFVAPAGDGTISVVAFRLAYTPTAGADQLAFTARLCERLGGPRAACSGDGQTIALRLAGPAGGLLCVVNPVDLEAQPVVTFADGRTVPSSPGTLRLAGRGARLLPLDLPLADGLVLRHATAELVERVAGTLVFERGDAERHELAVEGGASRVVVDGADVVDETCSGDLLVLQVAPTAGRFTLRTLEERK